MSASDAGSTPKPVGPYTPAVRTGHWIVCSGQVALRDGKLIDEGISAQVRQCIANLRTLLESEGAGLESVVKTTVFLADIGDYAAMNEAYVDAFGGHRPARSAFAVAGLPLGALVEIEAWAHVRSA